MDEYEIAEFTGFILGCLIIVALTLIGGYCIRW
jgi:hypothetical protein